MSIPNVLGNKVKSEFVTLANRLYLATCTDTEGQSHETIASLLYALWKMPDVKANDELANGIVDSFLLLFTESRECGKAAEEWVKGLPPLRNAELPGLVAKAFLERVARGESLEQSFALLRENITEQTHPEIYYGWGSVLARMIEDEDVPEKIRTHLREAVGMTTEQIESDENLSDSLAEFFRKSCMRSLSATNNGKSQVEAELPVKENVPEPENTTEESPVGQNFAQRENTTEETVFLRLREMAHKRVFDSTEDQLRAMIRACDDLSIPPTFEELSDKTRRLLDRLLSHPDCPEGFEDAMQHMASEFSNNEYGNSGNVHIRGIFP